MKNSEQNEMSKIISEVEKEGNTVLEIIKADK